MPERVLASRDLERLVETSDARIVSRTGIRERRIAAECEGTASMLLAASRQALAVARAAPERVQLVIAGTKISFNRGTGDTVPPSIWPRIWRRQLRLRSEGEFWRGLDGTTVESVMPRMGETDQPLPLHLARHLREDRHLTDDVIATLTWEAAQHLLNEWYGRDRSGA